MSVTCVIILPAKDEERKKDFTFTAKLGFVFFNRIGGLGDCETLMSRKDDNQSGKFLILNFNVINMITSVSSLASKFCNFGWFRRSWSYSGGLYGSSHHNDCIPQRFLPIWWVKSDLWDWHASPSDWSILCVVCKAAFERRRYMNVVVQRARHPELRDYIHSAASGLLPFIEKVSSSSFCPALSVTWCICGSAAFLMHDHWNRVLLRE